jgi:hypothetical protein
MRRHLTFANVIGLIALFVVLGGGVYAAAKISGSKIKKESIAGNRLKPNGVTGQQVDESSLGKVPKAESADSAQTAQRATSAQTAETAASAETLAGTAPGGFVSSADVKQIRFDVNVGAGTSQDVLQLGPLTLTAGCNPDGPFTLHATSSSPNAGIDIGYALNANSAASSGFVVGPAPPVLVESWTGADTTHRSVGNIVYTDLSSPTATTITIPFAVFYEDAATTRCFLSGIATRTSG